MKRIFLIITLILFCISLHAQILKKPIPDKLVVLTFDDATLSQYENVAPLLEKYGFGATFFICEFPTEHDSLYMNWSQIKELHKRGFEIANHTRTHPKISSLSPEKQTEELNYIERKCYSLNIPQPTSFAYPGYDFSIEVIELLLSKGYNFSRAGGSRSYNPLTDHPLLIPSWALTAENKNNIMDAFKQALNGNIVVLTIHGVPDIEHPWVNTPLNLFEEYIKYLSENKFSVISLRSLNEYINVDEAKKLIKIDLNKPLKNE